MRFVGNSLKVRWSNRHDFEEVEVADGNQFFLFRRWRWRLQVNSKSFKLQKFPKIKKSAWKRSKSESKMQKSKFFLVFYSKNTIFWFNGTENSNLRPKSLLIPNQARITPSKPKKSPHKLFPPSKKRPIKIECQYFFSILHRHTHCYPIKLYLIVKGLQSILDWKSNLYFAPYAIS